MGFNKDLETVWLVGGSSKLGLSVASEFEETYNVVNISRRPGRVDSNNYQNYSNNLSDISSTATLINRLMDNARPRAVIFCQRYRQSSILGELDILEGINTEIISASASGF